MRELFWAKQHYLDDKKNRSSQLYMIISIKDKKVLAAAIQCFGDQSIQPCYFRKFRARMIYVEYT